jgi:hypothetical protein
LDLDDEELFLVLQEHASNSIPHAAQDEDAYRKLLVLLVIVEALQERQKLVLVPSENVLDLGWLLRIRDEHLPMQFGDHAHST